MKRSCKQSWLRKLGNKCLIAFLLCGAVAADATDANRIESDQNCLSFGYDPRMGQNADHFKAFFKALYDRAGLCITSIPMNSKRKEALLLSGEIDGDWVRVEGFEEHSAGAAIALPQPVFYMAAEFLWTTKNSFSGNPADLKGRTVAYPSGFRWIQWNLEKRGAKGMPLPEENIIEDLLTRKRIPLYVTGSMNADVIANRALEKGVSLYRKEWQRIPFHHLLHKKNAALVPLLNTTLIEMIRSGEAARILLVPGIHIPTVKTLDQPAATTTQ